MGRITASLRLTNITDASKSLSIRALVDTGAGHITLPLAWREQFGKLFRQEQVLAGLADGSLRKAWVCGPLDAQIEDFRPFSADVLFIEMEPGPDGEYEPLIGYIALEEAGATADFSRDRLMRLPHVDLK
jgi:hypothetical protein